jgi:hypothetical protein
MGLDVEPLGGGPIASGVGVAALVQRRDARNDGCDQQDRHAERGGCA